MKKSEKKLCESCKKGSLEEVKRLLKKKLFGGSPNININESGIGNTPLINAAANGHETILKYLLDKGANIDGLNRNSETALIHALKNNQPEIARLLILEKADVLIKDTKDFYTTFAEVDLEVEDILYLAIIMFKYMPAHVEVVEPELIALTNNGWTDILSELTRRLHGYEEVARVLQFQNSEMQKKLKELLPENKDQEKKK